MTEIYDYLRLLYARVGIPHCPKCGREIQQQTIDQMVDQVMDPARRAAACRCWPPWCGSARASTPKFWKTAQKHGYVRVKIDGELYELDDLPTLDKKKKHTIEIVVDRLIVRNSDEFRTRLARHPGDRRQGGGGAGAGRLVRQGNDAVFPATTPAPTAAYPSKN